MKIIITENQIEKFLSKYYDELIKSPEFEWIDRIEVVKTSTTRGGWSRQYTKPVYDFTIFVNPESSPTSKDKNKIFDDISKMYTMLGFREEDEFGPMAYYSVNFIPE